MQEIGLPGHYNRANGSPSCEAVRKAAAERLAGALAAHRDAGDAIEAPDQDLMDLVKMVAEIGDESPSSLTKTWQACAYAIQGHMEGQAGISDAYARVTLLCIPTPEEKRERESFNVGS